MFNWLLALSGLSCIFIWFSISLAQIRVNYACKVQGIDSKNVPFKAIGGDYGAYFSMLINVLILMAQFYVGLYPINGKSLNASTFSKLILLFLLCWFSMLGTSFGPKIGHGISRQKI